MIHDFFWENKMSESISFCGGKLKSHKTLSDSQRQKINAIIDDHEEIFRLTKNDELVVPELMTIFSAKTCLSALDEIVSMRGTRWGGYFLIESASNNSVSHKIIRVSKKEIETEKNNWQWRLIYGRGK